MNLLDKFNNNLKYLFIVSVSLGIYSFMNNKSVNKITAQLELERNKFAALNNKYQDFLENKLSNSELEKIISTEKSKRLLEEMNELKEKLANQSSLTESRVNNIDNTESILSQLKDIEQNFQKSNNDLNSIVDSIEKYINSKNNNNFTDSFMNLIHDLNGIIQNMPVEQNIAFINISGAFFIIFSIFSILTVFYGDYLITKLNLENKYPKLGKFIKLRRKFQHFYILTDASITLIILFIIIYINTTFYFL
uniref:Uncharacterized protein n=1 Tax=Chroogomphus rutilus TaxID=85976 RepID=A0A8F0HYC0_9AGAM|nr:hypothetical protein [Chroogomphus rutilus]